MAPRISAKTGENVASVLERIVADIPAPSDCNDNAPLKALIFDSVYDNYKGVIVYVRVMQGTLKAGETMKMMATGAEFNVVDVGYMRATGLESCKELSAGEVGYITASIKTVRDAKVGDTVTIFGEDPTITELATVLGTIPYEILTSVPRRIERIIVK